jgi:hypothetical protein
MEKTVQATPRKIASGTWCRTEKFAPLRYVSQHRDYESAPDVEPGDELGQESKVEAEAAVSPKLAQDAGDLLRAMRVCNDRLSESAITAFERDRSLVELRSLKEKSWALMDCFWQTERMDRKAGRLENSEQSNRKVLEQGAAGWIAC